MKHTVATILFLILGLASRYLYSSEHLSADEVRKLFTGNTVESERREYGTPGTYTVHILNTFAEKSISQFAQDGTLDQQVGNQHKMGKWRVDDNGDLCVQLEDREEHCAPIVKQDNSYIRVIKNKKGRDLAQIRYLTFTSGTGR